MKLYCQLLGHPRRLTLNKTFKHLIASPRVSTRRTRPHNSEILQEGEKKKQGDQKEKMDECRIPEEEESRKQVLNSGLQPIQYQPLIGPDSSRSLNTAL